jgi:2-oxoglutarate/2-oxoacid ferredoxin oxidoreductase subunit beta
MDMKKVVGRSGLWMDKPSPYCPGCGHGIVHRLVCELLEEMGLADNCVFMAPVGCSILAYTFLSLDVCQPAHGRTPAAATGVKRARPDTFVVSYQGDGDLAAIGTAEIIHAANRGENITTIFVNNAIYGMTGGQMAPTTLLGQKTTTSPAGRDVHLEGPPIRVCEMLATMDGPSYIARVTVDKPSSIRKARQAIITAFGRQLDGKGFSLVEVLSPCPTYWRLPPQKAVEAIESWMVKTFPLGVYKDKEAANAKTAES